jgi:hypothetical protein
MLYFYRLKYYSTRTAVPIVKKIDNEKKYNDVVEAFRIALRFYE